MSVHNLKYITIVRKCFINTHKQKKKYIYKNDKIQWK